jgi:hypothetical protein
LADKDVMNAVLLCAVSCVVLGLLSCNSGSAPNEAANNLHRAEFKCDVELTTRLKLSADADFKYSDAHSFNGSYLIVGSFKDGAKLGRFSCDMQYLGGGNWKITGLRSFLPNGKVQVFVK